jgi:hypothetical protein
LLGRRNAGLNARPARHSFEPQRQELIPIYAKILADTTTLTDMRILADTTILADATKFGAAMVLGEAR